MLRVELFIVEEFIFKEFMVEKSSLKNPGLKGLGLKLPAITHDYQSLNSDQFKELN